MKHRTLWIWLVDNGLKQQDLAVGLSKSASWVSTRLRMVGFDEEDRAEILAWARKARPRLKVTADDLFKEAA